MGGTVAVGQGTAPKQRLDALRPPALHGVGLIEQIADRLLSPDEHQSLTDQCRLKDIAVFMESSRCEVRIPEEAKRFKDAGDGAGCRERTKGSGHRAIRFGTALPPCLGSL